MGMDNLNKWLTLVANIGVLLGIIFLAIEIQQNTNMMQAQTSDSVTDKQISFFLDTGTEPYSSDILVRGGSSENLRADLNPQEVNSYFLISNGMFRMWENELYQFERGLFSEEEFLPRIEAWRYQFDRSPGLSEVWSANKVGYSQGFVEIVDSFENNN